TTSTTSAPPAPRKKARTVRRQPRSKACSTENAVLYSLPSLLSEDEASHQGAGKQKAALLCPVQYALRYETALARRCSTNAEKSGGVGLVKRTCWPGGG